MNANLQRTVNNPVTSRHTDEVLLADRLPMGIGRRPITVFTGSSSLVFHSGMNYLKRERISSRTKKKLARMNCLYDDSFRGGKYID